MSKKAVHAPRFKKHSVAKTASHPRSPLQDAPADPQGRGCPDLPFVKRVVPPRPVRSNTEVLPPDDDCDRAWVLLGTRAATVSISGTRHAPCVGLAFAEALDSPFPIKWEGKLRHREAAWGPSAVQVFPPRVSGTSKANLCVAGRWGSPPLLPGASAGGWLGWTPTPDALFLRTCLRPAPSGTDH